MGARRKTKQKPAMVAPVEIPDAEHELVIERARRSMWPRRPARCACGCLASRGGGLAGCGTCRARSGAITELAQHLVELGVEKLTVESTSDYWRIWYYLLEDQGLDVQLVNARDVKNVPGRPKTDKLDAVWLAKLTEKGLLRPSFVPPAPIRVLRDYTRLSEDLIRNALVTGSGWKSCSRTRRSRCRRWPRNWTHCRRATWSRRSSSVNETRGDWPIWPAAE